MADSIPILTRKEPEVPIYVESLKDSIDDLAISMDIISGSYKSLIKSNEKTVEKEEEFKKEDRKQESEFLKNLQGNLSTTTENLGKGTFDLVLGPLKAITSPLESLTGFNLFEGLKSGIGGIFNKKYKGSITENKMRKEDPGSVWITRTLYKIFGKKEGKGEEEGGIFDTLATSLGLGGGASLMQNIGSLLPKVLGIGMIVAGVIMAVVDGIQGFFMAEEWGTSQVSGFLGGFLGGAGEGLEGAFKNMGKWALIGAGIGTLVAPVIGTLLGGLIGAAIGGILGWIGGENIAKFFDKVGEEIAKFFTKTVPEFAVSVWNGITGFFSSIWEGITGFFGGIFGRITEFFGSFAGEIDKFMTDPGKYIDDLLKGITDWFLTGFQKFLDDPVGFVANFFMEIGNVIKGFFDTLTGTLDYLFSKPVEAVADLTSGETGLFEANVQKFREERERERILNEEIMVKQNISFEGTENLLEQGRINQSEIMNLQIEFSNRIQSSIEELNRFIKENRQLLTPEEIKILRTYKPTSFETGEILKDVARQTIVNNFGTNSNINNAQPIETNSRG